MVEHNLAKVGVASSSLVFRSNKILDRIGAVVQLVRILACHARGRGFEPRPHRQNKRARTSEVLFFMKGTAKRIAHTSTRPSSLSTMGD